MEADSLWYYALAGQKAGPIPASELRRLQSVGVVNGSTLVWTEGWAEWRALGSVPGWETPQPQTPPLPTIPHAVAQATPYPSTDGMATSALICGIFGMTAILCCGTAPLCIAAIVLGHVTLGKTGLNDPSRQQAKIGLILGYVGLGILLLPLLYGAVYGRWFDELPNFYRKFRSIGV